jgi:formylglycine-generating enzyme required for sulfatase activity/tRNA A-37 threonylcarbamoyl transferase component Bud32
MPDSAQSSHPGLPQLAALALGKVTEAERLGLQAHLAECPACRKALASLPQVPGGSAVVSGQETLPAAGAAAPGATVDYRPPSNAPADLAYHPRYEILKLLGQGGMGAVYQARHKVMDRWVALKVLNAQLVASATAIERFHREVQAAAQLHHANIVTAFDADQAGQTHFLVMEYVEGTDLARYIQANGPLPVAQACHFICQAALGLQHAHERGMVHRDIKPHNLMLTAGGVVKLMDFGLARLAREGASARGLTGENVLMGTADYIAPEQAQDAHTADIRADVYSLGCTLYHLLAGRAPFAGVSVVQKLMAHTTTPAPLAELPGPTPEGLRTVLAKMLEKDPARRYQTPGEVAQALAPFVRTAPAEASPPLLPPASPERSRRTTSDEPAGRVRRGWKSNRGRGWAAPTWIAAGTCAILLAGAWALFPAGWGHQPPETGAAPRVSGGADSAATTRPAALPAKFTNHLRMEFVLIPKGKFLMGGGGGTVGDKEREIGCDFYLGAYEVTQEQWHAVMGSTPSYFSRAGGGKDAVKDIPDEELRRFPVENVSWNDVQLFLGSLNAREKEPGWVYRLPKDEEWEYACRGGPASSTLQYGFDFYFEKPTNQLQPGDANFEHAKGLKRPCKVGTYQPNRLGLYDMHGNVWEWCADYYVGASRVRRGGAWSRHAGTCRAGYRSGYEPGYRDSRLGFRLARVPSGLR